MESSKLRKFMVLSATFFIQKNSEHHFFPLLSITELMRANFCYTSPSLHLNLYVYLNTVNFLNCMKFLSPPASFVFTSLRVLPSSLNHLPRFFIIPQNNHDFAFQFNNLLLFLIDLGLSAFRLNNKW